MTLTPGSRKTAVCSNFYVRVESIQSNRSLGVDIWVCLKVGHPQIPCFIINLPLILKYTMLGVIFQFSDKTRYDKILLHGGFHFNRGTSKSSILFSDFPWNKPSSYGDISIDGNLQMRLIQSPKTQVDMIWVNYNDLTATSLESWFIVGKSSPNGLSSNQWIIIIYPDMMIW